ncbi:hypothetical protein [Tannockella kyphosi]|uniref:hypothetical protein n=1 Tax=Tannockella kyphosi TaxID=2899121 RepID=UPI002012C373|nr:hypothetical protein [Tannockella kyphosi]
MISFKKFFESFLLLFAIIFIVAVQDRYINMSLHTILYVFIACILVFNVFNTYSKRSQIVIGVFAQTTILVIQVFFIFFFEWNTLNTIVSILLLLLSFTCEYYIINEENKEYIFHTIDDTCLSFEDARILSQLVREKASSLEKAGRVINREVFYELKDEIPRNSINKYLNFDSLSDEYTSNLDKSLDDDYVYIVLSDTGSITSDVIGVFTNKPYNHASIAFDKDLKTLISYNGGQKVTPPGLNPEIIKYFCKKDDASIRVYRLPTSKQQKQEMINKIKQINQEGSAYNLVGLALNKTYKANIMFCSQFVYNLLASVGLNYFEKCETLVKPTDLIELDYDRKLEFVETIQLSELYDYTCENKPIKIKRKKLHTLMIYSIFVAAIYIISYIVHIS